MCDRPVSTVRSTSLPPSLSQASPSIPDLDPRLLLLVNGVKARRLVGEGEPYAVMPTHYTLHTSHLASIAQALLFFTLPPYEYYFILVLSYKRAGKAPAVIELGWRMHPFRPPYITRTVYAILPGQACKGPC